MAKAVLYIIYVILVSEFSFSLMEKVSGTASADTGAAGDTYEFNVTEAFGGNLTNWFGDGFGIPESIHDILSDLTTMLNGASFPDFTHSKFSESTAKLDLDIIT